MPISSTVAFCRLTYASSYLTARNDFYQEFAAMDQMGVVEWRKTHERLLRCCKLVWEAVKDVLCFESPEGHVVIETDDEVLDMSVKDTLSYCWRALKEAR
jgi:hypothetical protein